MAALVPIPFSRRGVFRVRSDVEVRRPSEGEAKHCAGKDNDYLCISIAKVVMLGGVLHRGKL